jgi:lipopolysaccharide/colanic/teichoic acid biosynthesis glycosyltransferase
VGRGGKIFRILKFRSMDKNAHTESPVEHYGEVNNRVTFVGYLLRATAMDELPQLFSIFMGDMSFVGPRPIHPLEIKITGSKYKKLEDVPGFEKRCSAKPGLTGLAQVYATKDIPIEKKIKYDLLYIKKQSFLLDIKLIFLSFLITFKRKWESKNKKL